MEKSNCWEFKKCGRQPGGAKVGELGVCPAALDVRANGVHGGKNGGRACWVLAGTYCGGKIQGSYAEKIGNCLNCEIYMLIRKEEGVNFLNIKKVLEKLK